MSGIFNAAIFNRAVFNTGIQIPIIKGGGWSKKRKKRKKFHDSLQVVEPEIFHHEVYEPGRKLEEEIAQIIEGEEEYDEALLQAAMLIYGSGHRVLLTEFDFSELEEEDMLVLTIIAKRLH